MKIDRLNGSFLSFTFAASAVGFISIAVFAKTAPLLVAKAVYFCRQFVSSNTLLQIPQLLPGIIAFILGAVFLVGVVSFLLQAYKTKLLVNKLLQKKVVISQRLYEFAKALNLSDKITLAEDNSLFSFCYGLFFPRILITTSLASSLGDKELEAVLLHEKAHLKVLDPFKILLGKAISAMFFFLPIFAELNKNMNATNEILADRYVSEQQQQTTHLKNALKKILIAPQIRFATVPAISNSDYLEIRINRLVNPTAPHSFHVSWMSICTSVLFFLFAMFLLQAPVSAFHIENTREGQQCHDNAQNSTISTSEQLFTPVTPSYEQPSYR